MDDDFAMDNDTTRDEDGPAIQWFNPMFLVFDIAFSETFAHGTG